MPENQEQENIAKMVTKPCRQNSQNVEYMLRMLHLLPSPYTRALDMSAKYWTFLDPSMLGTLKSSMSICSKWTARWTRSRSPATLWKRYEATFLATASDDIVLYSEWLTTRNHVPSSSAKSCWVANGSRVTMLLIVLYFFDRLFSLNTSKNWFSISAPNIPPGILSRNLFTTDARVWKLYLLKSTNLPAARSAIMTAMSAVEPGRRKMSAVVAPQLAM